MLEFTRHSKTGIQITINVAYGEFYENVKIAISVCIVYLFFENN